MCGMFSKGEEGARQAQASQTPRLDCFLPRQTLTVFPHISSFDWSATDVSSLPVNVNRPRDAPQTELCQVWQPGCTCFQP